MCRYADYGDTCTDPVLKAQFERTMHNPSITNYDKTRTPDELDDQVLWRVKHFDKTTTLRQSNGTL